MKIKPLEDRVVVKPQEAEAKTAGGIVLPDAAKEKPLKKQKKYQSQPNLIGGFQKELD